MSDRGPRRWLVIAAWRCVAAAAAAKGKRPAASQALRAAARHEVVGALGDAVRRAVPEKAFKAARRHGTCLNAQGDPQKQKTQAEQCLANGAKVILLDQLDSGSGAAITKLAVEAEGAKVIDYDRLVDGSKAVVLRLVRQRQGRQAPGPGPGRRPEGEGQVRQQAVVAELNGGSPTTTRCCSRAATTRS